MKLFTSNLTNGDVAPVPIKKIYKLVGQSNTDGRGELSGLPVELQGVIPNCLVWWNDEWQPLEAGVNASLALKVGFIINFAYLIQEANPNETHYFHIAAVGGTNIDYWSYPSGVGYINGFNSYRKAYLSLPDFKLQGFWWLQGESDGLTEPLALAYENKEIQLITDYKREYNASQIPWHTINIGNVTAGGVPFADTVRQGKINNNTNNIYQGYYDAYNEPLRVGDEQHFTTAAEISIGEECFNML